MSKGIQNLLLLGIAAGVGFLAYHQFVEKEKEDVADRAFDTVDDVFDRAQETISGRRRGDDARADPDERSADDSGPGDADDDRERDPLADLIDIGFDAVQEGARAADDVIQNQFPLSVAQELEIGAEVHRQILETHPALDDRKQLARIERLAAEVLALGSRLRVGKSAPKYTFTIIDSDVVNAFAHVGGYIYIHTGLIDLTTTDAELQFVLGHEIGHVELGHTTRGMSVASAAGQLGGDALAGLAVMAHRMISLGYSQNLELESDAFGYVRLRELGVSKKDAISFHYRMLAYEQKHGRAHKNERAGAGGKLVERLDEHFATHPETQKRIDRLEARTD